MDKDSKWMSEGETLEEENWGFGEENYFNSILFGGIGDDDHYNDEAH